MAAIAMATDYIMCYVKYVFEEHMFHLSYDDSFIWFGCIIWIYHVNLENIPIIGVSPLMFVCFFLSGNQANVGQDDDFDQIREKAIKCGALKVSFEWYLELQFFNCVC